MVAHSCNLSTWERWGQEAQMFNTIDYIESEANQGCKRRKLAAPSSTLLPIVCSQLLELSFRHKDGRAARSC